ncbi:hypothetical protein M501DRAFT_1060878 [Patellaria atrata CBS 101060]|uniref:GPI anchored protein n=1 Tax=Patellaria atrata CBS 101060 TaxID=1346257 RepID=A0A9P4S419_9PEZI|nr:hypothetical protein M501DRAFT_1060878 [Patellaria atrata CBS 101060]
MYSSSRYGLFVFYLFSALSHAVTSVYDVFTKSSVNRRVAAARPVSRLSARSSSLELLHDFRMVYAEVDNSYGGITFAANIHISSAIPALYLEDFDHLIRDVECYDDKIVVEFLSSATLGDAVEVLRELGGSYVITFHSGCNLESSRMPYRVNEGSIGNDGALTLQVTPMEWREAFPKFRMEYGHTNEGHSILDHRRLKKRSALSQTIISTADLFPTSTDVVTATATTTQISVATQILDSTFAISNGASFEVGCKNCTTTGTLDVGFGSFDFDPNININSTDIAETDVSFFKSGFIDIVANDVSAWIELKAVMSTEPFVFLETLWRVPVLGVTIPNFGAAGLWFEPAVRGDVAIYAALELTWGFKVTVPDGSRLRIDMGELNDPLIEGFPDTTFETIPFNASIEDLTLNVGIAFRPRFALGFTFEEVGSVSFLNESATAEAGIYLELPRLHANISRLSGVGATCEPLTSSETENRLIGELFGDLTHIEPFVDVGLGWEVSAEFLIPHYNLEHDDILWNMSKPLPTMCLVYGDDEGFAAATAVLEEAMRTAEGSASAGSNSNGSGPDATDAAASNANPFRGRSGYVVVLGVWCLSGLLGVTGFFLSV